MAHGLDHLRAQELGVVAEVAAQGVAVDDDAVRHVVPGRAVAVVEAVGAAAAPAVRDDHGDVVVLDERPQEVGELVEGVAHELLEVLVGVGVEVQELDLVGLGRGALAREALRALHHPLEVLLGLGLLPARQAQPDEGHEPEQRGRGHHDDREGLHEADDAGGGEARERHQGAEGDAQGDRGGDGDAAVGRRHGSPRVAAVARAARRFARSREGYPRHMQLGTSRFLIALGAILKYAVTASVSGVSLGTVGVILMVIGVLGLVLSVLMMTIWADRAGRTAVAVRDPADPRY